MNRSTASAANSTRPFQPILSFAVPTVRPRTGSCRATPIVAKTAPCAWATKLVGPVRKTLFSRIQPSLHAKSHVQMPVYLDNRLCNPSDAEQQVAQRQFQGRPFRAQAK